MFRFIYIGLILLMWAVPAAAQRGNRTIDLNVNYGNSQPIHHTGPIDMPTFSIGNDPCFPSGCRGLSGPFTNPDPEKARSPENLTSCIYNVSNTLIYERKGKVCPYKYVIDASNVEQRRQEWLKTQEE